MRPSTRQPLDATDLAASSNPNIAARLQAIGATHAGETAIVECRGRARSVITFDDLARRVAALSAGLSQRGVEPGDGVVIFLPMSIDLYVALLAVVHAGACAVFVDAWADRSRLDSAISLANPKALIGSPKSLLLRLRSGSVARIPIVLAVGRRMLRLARLERPGSSGAAMVTGSTPAVVTFTTGSTGRPRGVVRTHGMLWAQHLALREHLGAQDADVDMPTLPIFVLNNLASGIRTVLPDFDPRRPADLDPVRILRQMAREGVTTTSGSPAFFAKLVDWCEAQGETIPVRAAFTGGAPVPPDLARRLATPVIVGTAHVVFGATEVEPVAGIPVPDLVQLLDQPTEGVGGLCVGPPVRQLQVQLLRPTDGVLQSPDGRIATLAVPVGEIGEITVSGDYVLPGYLHDEVANQASRIVADGREWFRTGDCAWLDEQGRLWLVGRLSLRIRRAGEVVWPVPLELRALALPFVRHAAAIGLPDLSLGEKVALCLEVPGGLTRDQEQASRDALKSWPVDQVIGLKRIPRDPRHQSKTDTAALRRLLASRPGGQAASRPWT